MHSSNLNHHISSQFNLELEDIHDKVLAMGGFVEQQFKFAVQAFMDGDAELAAKVIHRAQQVDDDEIAVNKTCSTILARRQPAAFDLRMLIINLKTITELVRIGEIARHIASRTIRLGNFERQSDNYYELLHLYELVRNMLHYALETYSHLKNGSILNILSQDENVNHESMIIFRQLVALMTENPHHIKHTMNVLFTVRDIEHVAEHAIHICKNIVFLIKGENVDHLDADEIAKKLD